MTVSFFPIFWMSVKNHQRTLAFNKAYGLWYAQFGLDGYIHKFMVDTAAFHGEEELDERNKPQLAVTWKILSGIFDEAARGVGHGIYDCPESGLNLLWEWHVGTSLKLKWSFRVQFQGQLSLPLKIQSAARADAHFVHCINPFSEIFWKFFW